MIATVATHVWITAYRVEIVDLQSVNTTEIYIERAYMVIHLEIKIN